MGALTCTPLPLVPKILKFLFIFFNIIFALFGLALIAVGAWLLATGSSFQFLFGSNIIGGAAVIVICGGITFILAALGVVGAILQNRLLLVIFAIALTIIVIMEIAGAIVGFVFRDSLEMQFRLGLERALNGYETDADLRSGLDLFQTNFECCGATNSSDWLATSFYTTNSRLPDSCCNSTTTAMMCNTTTPGLFPTGCISAATGFLNQNIGYAIALGAVALVIGLLEILGIVLSLALCICIHRSILSEV